jgi:hypothetical protein
MRAVLSVGSFVSMLSVGSAGAHRGFLAVGHSRRVGGLIEAAAVLSTLGLFAVERGRGRASWLTAGAAVGIVVTHGLFWLGNFPVNRRTKNWTDSPPPEEWPRLRDRWEISHASRAGLATLALGALAGASVVDARARA